MALHSSTLAWKIPWMEEPDRLQSMGVARSGTQLSDFTFTFHFHALEKEMYIHKVVTSFTEVSYHFLGVNVHATSSRFHPFIICLCSSDLPFTLLCANNMHTKNISRI